jgi:DTW domain-containing protein YfiP
MPRLTCKQCQRPEIACICTFITPINNHIDVIVLQHPSEVTQVKGTVALLSKSLRSCEVIVDENFSDNQMFIKLLKKYQPLLLYPGEQARVLNNNDLLAHKVCSGDSSKQLTRIEAESVKPYCLIILDGTWKKAYRIFMLSEQLQQLPQICLPDELAQAGQYHIRKVAKRNALSSLEACCYALALLEHSIDDTCEISPSYAGKYQDLMHSFIAFNDFQLSFRPKLHINK